jgi:transcriptional regulator with XRE-family HTH domain
MIFFTSSRYEKVTMPKGKAFKDRLADYITENFNGDLAPFAELLATKNAGSRRVHQKKDVRKFASLLSRWRAGESEPSAANLRLLFEATGVSADHWLLENRPRYPWEPAAWTPETSRTFALDFFASSAMHYLEMPDRKRDLEALDGFDDFDAYNEIVEGARSKAREEWFAEMHSRVRLYVEQELTRRIAWHRARTRKEA